MHTRSLLLHYLNRELNRSTNRELTFPELGRITRIYSLATDGRLFLPFAQFHETCSGDQELLGLIEALGSINKIKLVNSASNFNDFIEDRRDLYKEFRRDYGVYFKKKPLGAGFYSPHPHGATTNAIKGFLGNVSSGEIHPNWLNAEEISRLRRNAEYLRREIIETPRGATFSVFRQSNLQPQPKESMFIGRIVSTFFTRNYAVNFDCVVPTGVYGEYHIEDYDYFPYFDLEVHQVIFSRIGIDELIFNSSKNIILLQFISNNLFSRFVQLKNSFLEGVVAIEKSRRGDSFRRKEYIPIVRELFTGFQGEPTEICDEATNRMLKLLENFQKHPKYGMYFNAIEWRVRMDDILVLTATDVEDAALRAELFKRGYTGGHLQIHDGCTSRRFSNGSVQIFHVRTGMGAAGMGGSQHSTSSFLRQVHVNSVFSVGICFGFPNKGVSIGDVIVASSVFDYELAKLNPEKIEYRGDISPTNFAVQSYARQKLHDYSDMTVRVGGFVSGQKIVNSSEFRDALSAAAPTALGGEMEAFGIISACIEENVKCSIIKGVCDIGEKKDDTFQRNAAANAFRFLFDLIDDFSSADHRS